MSTPSKDTYLRAAGWTFVDKMWMDPRKDAAYHKRNGGYCNPDNAVRKQRDYERFDKGLPIYAVCPARDHYGYLLRKCLGEDKPYVTIARYHDQVRLQKSADLFNAETDPEQLEVSESMLTTVDSHHYPYLLVFAEKHGSRHFHVPTRADFLAACLKVLKERAQDADSWGYWSDSDGPIEPPSLTKEQAEALPVGRVKELALQEIKTYEAEAKRREVAKKEDALLNKALKGDGEAAADFLMARKDGEYEGFELVTLESLENAS